MNLTREPTPDERDGMRWWNRLTIAERGAWLNSYRVNSAADAWAFYMGRIPAISSAQEILAEHEAHEQKIVDEREVIV